jgi:hypothetical protein
MTREKIYSPTIVRYTGKITSNWIAREFMVNEQDERSIGEIYRPQSTKSLSLSLATVYIDPE